MKIAIVGGGICGLATGWALAKTGVDVMLFEQGDIPNPLSASGDLHRIIRRAYGEPGYAAMIDEAYDAWNELWDDLGANHYEERGFLAISQTAGDEGDRYRKGLEAGGYAFTRHDGHEIAQRWPFFDASAIAYGVHSEEGGVLHCRDISTALAGWLVKNGMQIRTRCKVVAIDAEAGEIRLSTGEKHTADKIVVCAGAWTTQLFPQLRKDLTPYRTAVVYLDPPERHKASWANAPVVLDIGGTADGFIIPPTSRGGLKFGAGIHKTVNENPDSNRRTSIQEGQKVRDLFMPPIGAVEEYRVIDCISCAYIFTADERFLCRQQGQTLIVSACSGHGYKFGAAVGRRVSEWAEDGDTDRLARWLEGR